MNATIDLKEWAAGGLAVGAALLGLGGQAAYATPTNAPSVVATSLGSQDPRDTKQSTYTAGVVPSRLRSPDPRAVVSLDLVGAVRPDGPTLRAAFDDLAARAAKSRKTSSSRTSELASTGSGFSWRDAAIGGACTLLVVGLVGLGLAATLHRSKHAIHV